MFPFILIGRFIAMFRPLKKEYDFFMFFPSYGIGGAEKINATVLDILEGKNIIVFFTRKSPGDALLYMFQKPYVKIYDISKYTDNKFIYWANLIYRGIISGYIKKQKTAPVVFNGQCNFAYKLFPHLSKKVLKVELIHTSEKRFSWVTFPYIPFIDTRIMVSENIIKQHLKYYSALGVPTKYNNRIKKIFYTIPVPQERPIKKRSGKVKVYYAGRGGFQKRLEVLFEMVRICLKDGLPVEFHFAGSFRDEIPEDIFSQIIWHGQIGSADAMYDLHRQMDILILTSRFEGFPLAIMEAMSCGVSIVATAVDGIPEHIVDYKNGILIKSQEEEDIIQEGVIHLKTLIADADLRSRIAENNFDYAQANFSKSKFKDSYWEVFRLNYRDSAPVA